MAESISSVQPHDVDTFADSFLTALADAGIVAASTLMPATQREWTGYTHVREDLLLQIDVSRPDHYFLCTVLDGQHQIWQLRYDDEDGWEIESEEATSVPVNEDPPAVPALVAQLERIVTQHGA